MMLACVVTMLACGSVTTAPRDEVAIPTPGTGAAITTAAPRRSPSPEESVVGVLRVAARPDAPNTKLDGVWLEREDGARWVLAYHSDKLWESFADERVRVTGAQYEPEEEASVGGIHFRVDSLELADRSADVNGPFISFGPEESISGVLGEYEYPKGTKLEGSRIGTFEASGSSFLVLHIAEGVQVGSVTVRARKVHVNPFQSRIPGTRLWIYGLAKD